MYKIIAKSRLSGNASRMVLSSPRIARKAQAGQFVILRALERSERIPLTIHDHDSAAGTLTVVYQVVGAGTTELDLLEAGDSLRDLAGPLGRPIRTEGISRACVIGGGVGSAIAYPIAKRLKRQGSTVHSIIGFRNRDLVFLEDEFRLVSDLLRVVTDDGSHGACGLVTTALAELLAGGERYDEVMAIGPLMMMKSVSNLTREHGIRTTVSMNPIMVDGTGMCGGCRLTVGGEVKFGCVDGPDFDGHLVDFDEVMERNRVYEDFEKRSREESCLLFGQAAG